MHIIVGEIVLILDNSLFKSNVRVKIFMTYIILLTSITYVYKSQNILSNNGIKSGVKKLQARHSRKGCGYGLEVHEYDLYESTRLLEEQRIKIIEII